MNNKTEQTTPEENNEMEEVTDMGDFKNSNYYHHAVTELEALGYKHPDEDQEDGPNKWIQENLLELLEVFSNQGHSGFSANYCISAFSKLAAFEPLSPLHGRDEEWNYLGDEMGDDREMYQNKRYSAVFKDGKDGQPYYIDAIVFREEDGCCFTRSTDGISSSQYIKGFPFVPKTFYVDVKSWEVNKDDESVVEPGSGWWVYEIKDQSQLEEIFEYYDKKE